MGSRVNVFVRTKILSYYCILLHHSRVRDHLKFPYWPGDIRLSVHFSSRPIEASVCHADLNVCLPLHQSRLVETVQCVCEVAFCEVLCVVKCQMSRRLVIIPANVLRLVTMKLRRTLLREDGIGVEDESFACFLVSIIVNTYHRLETDTVVTLTLNFMMLVILMTNISLQAVVIQQVRER